MAKVNPTTALVMLITDMESGIGAMVGENGEAGVVEGTAGKRPGLKMRFFSRDPDVSRDQAVVTSGLGAIFPRGLLVGKISGLSREREVLFTADVQPYADFDNLYEVMVIRRSSP